MEPLHYKDGNKGRPTGNNHVSVPAATSCQFTLLT